jgi:two-component system, sensor histidine kinase and response regulator
MESSASDKIDVIELMERVEGDMELLGSLVAIYFADSPRCRDEIAAAINGSNSQALQHAAHALKGMLGVLAAQDGYNIALQLEKIGHGGELAAASDALKSLDQELEILKPVLSKYLTQE